MQYDRHTSLNIRAFESMVLTASFSKRILQLQSPPRNERVGLQSNYELEKVLQMHEMKYNIKLRGLFPPELQKIPYTSPNSGQVR